MHFMRVQHWSRKGGGEEVPVHAVLNNRAVIPFRRVQTNNRCVFRPNPLRTLAILSHMPQLKFISIDVMCIVYVQDILIHIEVHT